jgi:hypothetical protein
MRNFSHRDLEILCWLSATRASKLRFDFRQGVRAKLRGDSQEFLTVRVAAIYLIKTTRCITGSADNGRAFEDIVYERSWLGAVKQAGARLGFQTNHHIVNLLMDVWRDQTVNRPKLESSPDYHAPKKSGDTL